MLRELISLRDSRKGIGCDRVAELHRSSNQEAQEQKVTKLFPNGPLVPRRDNSAHLHRPWRPFVLQDCEPPIPIRFLRRRVRPLVVIFSDRVLPAVVRDLGKTSGNLAPGRASFGLGPFDRGELQQKLVP